MKDSKLAEGGLGKKGDIRLAKKLIKGLQGIDTPAAKEMKALMNEVLAGGYKPVKKKDGGLMEAIEKVKAKEMKEGGDPTKELVGGQKKLDKNKDGKISGEDFKLLRAEPMKLGGVVKMGAGGGVCKGMGIARAGGKFKLR